jgi:hypothetical protein
MPEDVKVRPVKIKLDRERNYLLDLNAFEELENIYGDIHKAFYEFQNDTKKMKHIKNFLYAGLVHEDETLTPTKIGKMIGYANLAEVTDFIWLAAAQKIPDPKEGSESDEGEQ